jgi:Plasmid pRiA4b ORF-3-like protein
LARRPYTYDFGDGWEHTISVEKVLAPDPGVAYPVCTAGKLSGPPEDCGGLYGYYNLLEAIRDPDHEEHEEMLEWIGGEIDPDAFSIDEVNERLKPFQHSKGRAKADS